MLQRAHTEESSKILRGLSRDFYLDFEKRGHFTAGPQVSKPLPLSDDTTAMLNGTKC